MGKPNKFIARLSAALRGPSVFIARLPAGLRGLKAQQVRSPGQRPGYLPCPHSLRPVRAKVKANHLPLLLPLQGVGVYALIPRALPWAMHLLPFQGARGEGCGARCPCKGLISRILLRRQHCSSHCSQSEGHEHVAKMP